MTILVANDAAAEMRDGTILRADVYRPAGGGPFPTLLRRTPYNKAIVAAEARALATRGYLVVVQDLRGRHASDGEYVWMFGDNTKTFDAQDGFDTVEWASELPHSNGRVGVWGHSYDGWCCWMLAPTRPPHLKAMFASGISAHLLDFTYGHFETGRRLQWCYERAADARRRSGARDGPLTDDDATADWGRVERGKWVWFTPLDGIPDHVFSTLTPQLKRYYRESHLEFYNFDRIHSQVQVPVMMLTGWWDRLIHTIDNFTGMEAHGPLKLRGQHRLVIGPWGHDYNNSFKRRLGPLDNGPEADASYTDVVGRWFDLHLRGIDDGLNSEPPIRLFVLGENHWRYENEWPLARTQYRELYLHSNGGANTVWGNGNLSWSQPESEPPDEYDYNPRDPLMSLMGLDSQAEPCDQRPIDSRTDNLVYMTPALDVDLEVTGPITLKLWAASNVPDTDWVAKLIDVHPNGLAINLSYGIVRARYRNGFESPSFLEPGLPYEYTIGLTPTSMLFRKGHRIRLDVSSSDFPNFDRNHNTGADYWSDSEFRIAHQEICHSKEMPSRLILPVIPRT